MTDCCTACALLLLLLKRFITPGKANAVSSLLLACLQVTPVLGILQNLNKHKSAAPKSFPTEVHLYFSGRQPCELALLDDIIVHEARYSPDPLCIAAMLLGPRTVFSFVLMHLVVAPQGCRVAECAAVSDWEASSIPQQQGHDARPAAACEAGVQLRVGSEHIRRQIAARLPVRAADTAPPTTLAMRTGRLRTC